MVGLCDKVWMPRHGCVYKHHTALYVCWGFVLYVPMPAVHIRVCRVCTVWMQSMRRSDKVWMARLWRQVSQVAALSLRQLDIQPHHHPIQFHHQRQQSPNIWVWHMIMFGQMDEVVCIFRSINRLSGYKGPVESVAQLKGTN